MSQSAFTDRDYSDGEIYPLQPGSALWHALTSETWINCSPSTRDYYVSLLLAPHYFSGTILSTSRHQVELTIIPFVNGSSDPGDVCAISVSLVNSHRFL